ncbi:MAG: bifunctional 3-(3-hydroxy-phenyl)propionate/3-hydroxycinnamic acid hydroxylase [Polaromonas sp.]|nr:bifunctional 3-(3-hydroxy-phenyl)propionate/3-hydroxycinnamic acid hydroxylase [Polaromonas sp.]
MDPVYDVAIVGFGPSGAVAANLLGQAGLKTYVCDRLTTVYDKPRAIALDHEIMRVFQQIGVADRVQQHVEPFTPSEYFGVDGQLIRRMTMVAPPFPLGYTPSMVFTQPPVERILREQAASWPGVSIELGVELVSLVQDDDVATLSLRDADGRQKSVRARYVVGCDGATSSVRALAGITLDDLDFDEPWLVVDVLVNAQGLARLPRTSVQYCEPDRPCTLVIGPGNHRRWEISLKEGEDPVEAAKPETTWKLLSRWLTPQEGELWRQASYRFHALLARDWRRGRLFVAGDAAHQQPPFMGQGMCQGIRDVANLAWKLGAVVKGEVTGTAAQALLDSYGEERHAHVKELTTRIKGAGAVICERDPARARARDQRMLDECGGVVKDTPRQDVIPRLEAGLLSAVASTGRGTLFPQPRLDDGNGHASLMDERVGLGWRLVTDSSLPAPGRLDNTIRLVRLGGPLAETEGVTSRWMHKHGCHAALVRPDHYVFGTAGTAPELEALLADWSGRWTGAGATQASADVH